MSSLQTHNDQHEMDATNDTKEQSSSVSGMGWLLPLLLLVLAAGLVLYFISGNKNDLVPGLQETVDTKVASAPSTDSPVIVDSSLLRKPLTIRINDSTLINAFQNGVEKQLLILEYSDLLIYGPKKSQYLKIPESAILLPLFLTKFKFH